jgi:signal transduction histidine kinase/tetratricopeptide (TPR) repeat protein
MKGRSHRKQILLFLIAVFLPSVVLVFLTIRMIGQERELSQKRMEDDQIRMARDIGQHLLVTLENIKLQERSAISDEDLLPAKISYVNPEVVLVGLVEGRQLLLPWEWNQELESTEKLLNDPEFIRKIRSAEREEFAQKNFTRASRLYNQAVNGADQSVQKEYARLLLARTFWKSGNNSEALIHYQKLLSLPYNLTDEYGIPLSLYAAGRLLELSNSHEEIIKSIQKEMNQKHWLSPGASYLLSDLIEELEQKAQNQSIQQIVQECKLLLQKYIQKQEQALALQNDFLTLGLSANQGRSSDKERSHWVSYGENSWLVSLAESVSEKLPLVIVVDVEDILVSLQQDCGFTKTFPVDYEFVGDDNPSGLSLGPDFPGMKIVFAENQESLFSEPWIVQPIFYLLALFLILGITLFGAYLLWRDVRREVSMADMRSQFVSSVSHELKTPLTAIRMFAETMRMGRSKDPKAHEEYLDTIVNESQRLTRLLNNVLDFSKIEQGKRIYHPEQASLYEIIQSAARAMEYPLSQQGFSLEVKTEEGLPDVCVDRDAIEQAVLNLLHNAMKYSGESRDIGFCLQKKDDHAIIKVVDHGIGIAPQEQQKIFDKFYRVPSPENERIVGTGLGLALVSHIVEAHKGYLEIESTLGKGSTFSIYLPLETG